MNFKEFVSIYLSLKKNYIYMRFDWVFKSTNFLHFNETLFLKFISILNLKDYRNNFLD